jgi:simple sugar transport system permease protein
LKAFQENLKKILLVAGKKILIVFIALAVIMLVLALTGYKPISVMEGMKRAVTSDIGNTLRWTAPLILCGLAVAIPMSAGVFNMGIDGQLMLGAITSAAIGLSLYGKMPPVSVIILALSCGAIIGLLWALIPAFLRATWGTDEVVTTLLLNYIAVLITDYLVMGPLMGEGATGTTYSTNSLATDLWLTRIIPQSSANIGLFIAIVIAIIVNFVLYSTTLGYEIKVVGTNSIFARYGGIKSKKTIIMTFLISGAIAGLVGGIEVFGVHHRFPGRFNTGLGFDGVVVSLMADNNPLGILFTGTLFGILRNGGMNMERVTEIPRAMVDVVQALIVLTATGRLGFGFLKHRKRRNSSDDSNTKNEERNNSLLAEEVKP